MDFVQAEYFEEDDTKGNVFKEEPTDIDDIKSNLCHRMSVHERLSCKICDYQASSQRNLKKHIQSVHEKIKYSCDLCDHQYVIFVIIMLRQKDILILSVHEKKERSKNFSVTFAGWSGTTTDLKLFRRNGKKTLYI